jgi:hypothetical protein
MGKSRTPKAPATTSADTEQDGVASVGRRALIRRAATVAAAGIGGIAATEMLSAGPAAAAIGDPLLLGGDGSNDPVNNAQTQKTVITSSAPSATFDVRHGSKIANMRLAPVDDSVDYGGDTPAGDPAATMLGGELLNLTEDVDDGAGGTLHIDTLFWMAGDNNAGNLDNLAVVLTTATGTVFVPYGPFRALGTRSSPLRQLVVDPTVLDSQHRLIGGKTLELDLKDFVNFAYAVHFNLTVVGSTSGGYLTAFGAQDSGGDPDRPLASNINFSKAQVIANHGVSPLSSLSTLYIFASATTHVVLDIQGWTLPDFSFLNTGSGGGLMNKQARPKGLGVVRRPVQRNRKG